MLGQLVKLYGTGRNHYALQQMPNSNFEGSSTIILGNDYGITDDDLGNIYSFEIKVVEIAPNYTIQEAYNLIKQETLEEWKSRFTHHCAFKNKPMKKQTSVEWLISKLENLLSIEDYARLLSEDVFEQAKQMEHERLIDFHRWMKQNDIEENAEQYFHYSDSDMLNEYLKSL